MDTRYLKSIGMGAILVLLVSLANAEDANFSLAGLREILTELGTIAVPLTLLVVSFLTLVFTGVIIYFVVRILNSVLGWFDLGKSSLGR